MLHKSKLKYVLYTGLKMGRKCLYKLLNIVLKLNNNNEKFISNIIGT